MENAQASGSSAAAGHGVPPSELDEADLLRELGHLHETRHATFRHGSDDALAAHGARTEALEKEYLHRHPDREVDAARTRAGARERQDA